MEYKLTFDKYVEGLKGGKLLGLRCKKCNAVNHPPIMACLECGSLDLEITELSGKGKIDSYTVIRVPPEGFEGEEPYVLARVKLEEGSFALGRLNIPLEKASFELLDKEVKMEGHINVPKEKYKFAGVDCAAIVFGLSE